MAKITEIRLTLAAFIYAIEFDIKNVIKKYISPYQEDLKFMQDAELEAKVISRFIKDNPGVNIIDNLDDAIDFIDFFDSFNIRFTTILKGK